MSLLAHHHARRALAARRDFVVPGNFYFNCGGPDYTDPAGRLWRGRSGAANTYDYGSVNTNPLWRTVVYDVYPPLVLGAADLPAGQYRLTAYLKEVYLNGPGQRLNGLQLTGGAILYQDVDGFNLSIDNATPPVVVTYGQPIAVGSSGLSLSLLGGNSPILNALSFRRL